MPAYPIFNFITPGGKRQALLRLRFPKAPPWGELPPQAAEGGVLTIPPSGPSGHLPLQGEA